MKAFGRIEKNPDLTIRDRSLTVVIAVAAIPVGYKWDAVGEDLLTWLKANHQVSPKEGESKHVVQVGGSSKLGPLSLEIWLQTMHLPDNPGATMISRGPMPKNLGEIVEKALGDKLPKLVATTADKRVLLVERQHISLGDTRILAFDDFRLRRVAELDALKLFFLFVAHRDRQTNFANIGYDKIEEYTDVKRARIKTAISLLASLSLIYVEHVPSKMNPEGIANAYRIVGVEPYTHMGTRGRAINEFDSFRRISPITSVLP